MRLLSTRIPRRSGRYRQGPIGLIPAEQAAEGPHHRLQENNRHQDGAGNADRQGDFNPAIVRRRDRPGRACPHPIDRSVIHGPEGPVAKPGPGMARDFAGQQNPDIGPACQGRIPAQKLQGIPPAPQPGSGQQAGARHTQNENGRRKAEASAAQGNADRPACTEKPGQERRFRGRQQDQRRTEHSHAHPDPAPIGIKPQGGVGGHGAPAHHGAERILFPPQPFPGPRREPRGQRPGRARPGP